MRRKKIFSRKRSRVFWRLGIFLLVLFFTVDIYLLSQSKILNVRTIDVHLDQISCTNRVEIASLSQIKGQNIFFVNSAEIEKKIKEKYLCVRDVKLSKNLPDKIAINVSGRTPVAALISLGLEEASQSAILDIRSVATTSATPINSTQLLVDSEGVIYSQTEESINIPKIYFRANNLKLGKKLEDNIIKKSLRILDKLKEFKVEVNGAKIISQKNLVVETKGNLVLGFLLTGNIDIQLASLQLILEEAKIKDIEMELIDLRFEKPVVKYVPKKK